MPVGRPPGTRAPARRTAASAKRWPDEREPDGKTVDEPAGDARDGERRRGSTASCTGSRSAGRAPARRRPRPCPLRSAAAASASAARRGGRSARARLVEPRAVPPAGAPARDRRGGREQEAGQQSRAHVGPVVVEPGSQPRQVDSAASGSMISCRIVPACSSSGSVDLLDAAPTRASSSTAASTQRRDPRVGPLDERPRRRPKPRSLAQLAPVRRHRDVGGRRVAGRGPRSPRAASAQSSALVRDRADRVERPGRPARRPFGDAARSSAGARDAAERGRDPDRAGGVGAERRRARGRPPRPRRCRRSSRRRSDRSPTGSAPGRNAGSSSVAPNANSCVFSLPTTIAPAARSALDGRGVAVGATLSARMREAAVVRVPATSITSLTATGTP